MYLILILFLAFKLVISEFTSWHNIQVIKYSINLILITKRSILIKEHYNLANIAHSI